MSGIPSDIAGSAAQAGFQARDVAKVRDADRAGQAHSTDRSTKAIDEAGSTVETEDGDTAVFTDAEGAGSQGRSFEDDLLSEEAEERDEGQQDPTRPAEGETHVDIEA